MAKGVTTYFSVVIMFLMLAVAMGLTNVIYYQIKMTRDASDSIIAFQIADSAVEQALYEKYRTRATLPSTWERTPSDPATYITLGNEGRFFYQDRYSETDRYKEIFAVGQFGKIKRALLVRWR